MCVWDRRHAKPTLPWWQNLNETRAVWRSNLPEPRASLDDLDLKALSELRGRSTDVDDLVALGLAVKQGARSSRRMRAFAACPDPTRFLTSAWVQCGRLRGASGTDIFDQTEIHGPMPLAVDRVMEFLLKSTPTSPPCSARCVGAMRTRSRSRRSARSSSTLSCMPAMPNAGRPSGSGSTMTTSR